MQIEKFGDLIFNARSYGSGGRMTQEEFGRLFNVRGVYIGKWENGTRYPAQKLLPEIAEFIGEDLEKLHDLIRYEKEQDLEIKRILEERLLLEYYGARKSALRKRVEPSTEMEPEVIYFRSKEYRPNSVIWKIISSTIEELED